MGAYANQNNAVAGAKADSAIVSRVESASALESISFGQPVFSQIGAPDVVSNYKLNKSTIVLSTALIADNSVIVTVNGVSTTATVYASSHIATMGAIKTKLEALGYTVTIVGSGDTALTMTIEKANTDIVATWVTTLGLSQPTNTVTQSSTQIFRGIAMFVQKAPGGYVANESVSIGAIGHYWVPITSTITAFSKAYFTKSSGLFTVSSSGTVDLDIYFQSNNDNSLAIVELK